MNRPFEYTFRKSTLRLLFEEGIQNGFSALLLLKPDGINSITHEFCHESSLKEFLAEKAETMYLVRCFHLNQDLDEQFEKFRTLFESHQSRFVAEIFRFTFSD